MQIRPAFFYAKFLSFFVFASLSMASTHASAYTLQDLLDADRAAVEANNYIAEVQNELYFSLPAMRAQIDADSARNTRNCQNPNAHPDAVRECFNLAAEEYEEAMENYQNVWNDTWFRLADAEAAYRTAMIEYNLIYDALYPSGQ